LQTFFRRHGLDLYKVENILTKGGSFRGYVRHLEEGKLKDPSVDKMMALEKRLGFDRLDTFKTFAKKVDSIKQNLRNKLDDIKSKEKRLLDMGHLLQ
jgi:transcriptional regulator with XRE-family HTH domain